MAGIKRELNAAIMAARREIALLGSSGDLYARGLVSAGFMGGYYQALCDVQLALNGVEPDRWRKWRKRAEEQKDIRPTEEKAKP